MYSESWKDSIRLPFVLKCILISFAPRVSLENSGYKGLPKGIARKISKESRRWSFTGLKLISMVGCDGRIRPHS